jgi:hypothetical protein
MYIKKYVHVASFPRSMCNDIGLSNNSIISVWAIKTSLTPPLVFTEVPYSDSGHVHLR